MAFLPGDAREALISEPLERLSPHTVVDPAALRALLDSVRSVGVAVSHSERQEGAASVAAPVFDNHGVAGAISVCGPEYRFDEATLERYRPLLKSTASLLSRELGRR
jgi:DNA-binding IclR family transcriptional regulator